MEAAFGGGTGLVWHDTPEMKRFFGKIFAVLEYRPPIFGWLSDLEQCSA